jgi:uncharacterized membrane protein
MASSTRSLASLALAGLLLAGCPSDPVPGDDAGTPMADTGMTDTGMTAMTDTGMTAMTDAGMMAMDDAGMMAMDDAGMMAMDDAGMMAMDDAGMAPAATWSEVHDQLTMRCTPCHSSGMSGGHRIAQTNATMAYASSQQAAGTCAGITVGACAAMRVRAGTMPPGGIADPTAREALADLMDSWVAAGQVGP